MESVSDAMLRTRRQERNMIHLIAFQDLVPPAQGAQREDREDEEDRASQQEPVWIHAKRVSLPPANRCLVASEDANPPY